GRLDQQRYRYVLWRPNPLVRFKMSQEEVYTELARRYFRWIGPASLAGFQGFSGLGLKATKEATAPLKLVPLPERDGLLMLPEELEPLRAFKAPKKPKISLVSSVDGLTLLRRDLKSLIAPEHAGRKVLGDKALEPVG